jgi:putative transposase
MEFSPKNIYHVYNQGNDRQRIFFSPNDYVIFLNLYERLIVPAAATIAWCLMPNHFHAMLYADERCIAKIKQGGIYIDPITNGFRKLLSGYARIFNNQNQRSGSVFRQKTKAKCLSDIRVTQTGPFVQQNYVINCFHYIHQNPRAAGLVSRLEDWEYSSYKDYAGLRDGTFCRKDLASLYCGYDPESFVSKSYELVDRKLIPFLK